LRHAYAEPCIDAQKQGSYLLACSKVLPNQGTKDERPSVDGRFSFKVASVGADTFRLMSASWRHALTRRFGVVPLEVKCGPARVSIGDRILIEPKWKCVDSAANETRGTYGAKAIRAGCGVDVSVLLLCCPGVIVEALPWFQVGEDASWGSWQRIRTQCDAAERRRATFFRPCLLRLSRFFDPNRNVRGGRDVVNDLCRA
jgi:hypothetical protein